MRKPVDELIEALEFALIDDYITIRVIPPNPTRHPTDHHQRTTHTRALQRLRLTAEQSPRQAACFQASTPSTSPAPGRNSVPTPQQRHPRMGTTHAPYRPPPIADIGNLDLSLDPPPARQIRPIRPTSARIYHLASWRVGVSRVQCEHLNRTSPSRTATTAWRRPTTRLTVDRCIP